MSGVAGVQDARSSMSIESGRSERVPKLSDSTRVAVPPAERYGAAWFCRASTSQVQATEPSISSLPISGSSWARM